MRKILEELCGILALAGLLLFFCGAGAYEADIITVSQTVKLIALDVLLVIVSVSGYYLVNPEEE